MFSLLGYSKLSTERSAVVTPRRGAGGVLRLGASGFWTDSQNGSQHRLVPFLPK